MRERADVLRGCGPVLCLLGIRVYPHDAAPREEGGAALDLHAHTAIVNFRYRAFDRARGVRVHVPQAHLSPDPRLRRRRQGVSGLGHGPQYTAGSRAETVVAPCLGSTRCPGPLDLELAMV